MADLQSLAAALNPPPDEKAQFAGDVRQRLAEAMMGIKAMQPQSAADLGQMAAYATPGLGTALSARDAYNAGTSGDYRGLAVALGGMFGGPLAKTADRAAMARVGTVPPEFTGTGATGKWFIEGDKPVYYSSTRKDQDALFSNDYAKKFDEYPSVTDKDARGIPHTVWFKPGESDRAQQIIDLVTGKAGEKFTPEYHKQLGLALGYPQEAVDRYVSKVGTF